MKRLIEITLFVSFILISNQSNPVLAQNVTIHPIPNFLTVNRLELRKNHIPPEMARNLRVAVCKKHFPIGSQGRRNVQAVVDLYNNAPYLGIRITLSEIKHYSEDALFTCPPPFEEDLVIDIVLKAPGPIGCSAPNDTLKDSGTMAYYLFEPVLARFKWTRANIYGEYPTHKAAMLLRLKNFRKYANTPLSNIADAPGQGIIAHELAHALYAVHPEARRDEKYQMLEGLCNYFGGVPDCVDLTHELDKRIARITAHTRFLYDKKYPPLTPFVDTKHEWVIHQLINKKNHLTEMRARDYRPIRYMNPFELYFDPSTGKLMDAKTRRVIWLHSQFSDASKLPANGDVLLTIKIRDRIKKTEIMLVSENIPVQTTFDYAQYHFDQHLTTQFQESDLESLFDSRFLDLVFKIDTDRRFPEYNEKDNRLATPIKLIRKRDLRRGPDDPIIDPDEANVPNKKDFRFASIYMEKRKIAFDINFYKHLNLSSFSIYLDTDQNGDPDFRIRCTNNDYKVFGKTGIGSFTDLINKGEPGITGGRYKFCFAKYFLGLDSGPVDYWLVYGIPVKDRLPDIGKYTFQVY